MSFPEIIRSAVANTFRSKVRAVLTILAIFVGAFTLTLTNGVGTGISNYIETQVSAFGADDVMGVALASVAEMGIAGMGSGGVVEYDPDRPVLGNMGMQLEAMTSADLERILATPGITAAEPMKMVTADYIVRGEGTRYEFMISTQPVGTNIDLVAGRNLQAGSEEVTVLLPMRYVEPMGFASPQAAIGETVRIAATSYLGAQAEVEATVVGVQEETIFALGAGASQGLIDALYDVQTAGLPAFLSDAYLGVIARFDPASSPQQIADIKAALAENGYVGRTVADDLGTIQVIIDAVVGVLNAFAIIALIAAGFGIINTLFMSVQERTREIGLMKAMGMGAGSIFGLFSTEAVFIGFLGSAIGATAAILLGSTISTALANGVLSDLSGLRVLEFDPVSVATVIGLVMLLGFLAGTLPALRAARLDPIDALRYE